MIRLAFGVVGLGIVFCAASAVEGTAWTVPFLVLLFAGAVALARFSRS